MCVDDIQLQKQYMNNTPNRNHEFWTRLDMQFFEGATETTVININHYEVDEELLGEL